MLQNFLSSEEGAITVDWVVLTAAVMLMGVGIAAAVSGAVDDSSQDISDDIIANTSS